jgi:branched-chain amino acid transport system permease protein
VSGAFLASYFSAVNAAQFQFSFSLFVFSMVVLGGVGSIRGVVLGAIVLSAINSYLLPDVLYSLPRRVGLDFDFSSIASGVYGAMIVFVILLRPQGLLPASWADGDRRRRASVE